MASVNMAVNPAEDVELKGWLDRLVRAINSALSQQFKYEPTAIMPEKFSVGTTIYFSQALDGTDITEEGLWVYKSTGWTLIA